MLFFGQNNNFFMLQNILSIQQKFNHMQRWYVNVKNYFLNFPLCTL